MVTLVAWREKYFYCPTCDQPMPYTEDSIWKNLARAYGANLFMLPFGQPDLPEGLAGEVVVLNENSDCILDDFVWPAGPVNIVTGRAAHNLGHLPGSHIRVPVPDTGVFGMCMAAIALEDRRRKLANGA